MANWTQEDLDRVLRQNTTTTREGRRVGIDGNAGHDSAGTEREIPTAARLGQKAKGTMRQPRGMNKTEAAYAAHLEMEKRIGDVLWFRYEGITVRLSDDCRFTADFAVMLADGTIELHDTKSLWSKKAKPHIEDDALVKLRTAAEMYPFKIRAVWKATNGEWDSKEF